MDMDSDEIDQRQERAGESDEPADDSTAVLAERRGESVENGTARLARLRRLAVQVDSQPALLAAADRLRRRLPGDARFGDPLSTADARPVAVVARGVSALQPRRKSVVQELGFAGLQLWQ